MEPVKHYFDAKQNYGYDGTGNSLYFDEKILLRI